MLDKTNNPTDLITDMGKRARATAAILARTPTSQKAKALNAAAIALREDANAILDANATDLAAGREKGLANAMLDRLALDGKRLEAIAAALEAVARLPDPVGDVIDESAPANGLKLKRVRVPLGVVGIIYESRPNVTADAGALAMMAGNAAILRGGTEAVNSNRAIHAALVEPVENVPQRLVVAVARNFGRYDRLKLRLRVLDAADAVFDFRACGIDVQR